MCFVLIGSGSVYLHSMLHGRLVNTQNHITHTLSNGTGILELAGFLIGTTDNLFTFFRSDHVKFEVP